MMWLLLVLGLRWAGLPWFAALGFAILAFLFFVGLDPLVLALDFSRLRDYEELLALPFLWVCAGLLVTQAQRPGSPSPPMAASIKICAGDWLVERGAEGKLAAVTAVPVAALLIAPSATLVLVCLIMQALSSTRTPDLQLMLLAGLAPALLAVPVAVLWSRSRDPVRERQGRPADKRGFVLRLDWLLIAGLLAGLYLGRWGILEAAAFASLALAIQRLRSGVLRPVHIQKLVLDSLRDFGWLALLMGLGLAWMAVVFDSGMDRHWMARVNPGWSGTYLGIVLAGAWLSAAWIAGAWLLKPLPALIVGAPFIVPAALAVGMAPEQLALVSVLSLYTGYRLGQRVSGPERSDLHALLLAIALILMIPALSLWLPGLVTGGA